MTNSFNKVAPFYDCLSWLIYGNAQKKVQQNQLIFLHPGMRILIVGGGTGWILEAISNKMNSGLQIVYVEMAPKMMKRSQTRNVGNNEVIFVNDDIENYSDNMPFDIIMTPFLFDNFSEQTAGRIFEKLHALLKPNGHWLTSDFSLEKKEGRWWKQLLTKAMYLFFKLFGIVEGNQLIDLNALFLKYSYVLIDKRFYNSGFIKGSVYRR